MVHNAVCNVHAIKWQPDFWILPPNENENERFKELIPYIIIPECS